MTAAARTTVRELTPLAIVVTAGLLLLWLMGVAAQDRWCGPQLCTPADQQQPADRDVWSAAG